MIMSVRSRTYAVRFFVCGWQAEHLDNLAAVAPPAGLSSAGPWRGRLRGPALQSQRLAGVHDDVLCIVTTLRPLSHRHR